MKASKTSLAFKKHATGRHTASCATKHCAPSYHPYVNHAACVEHRQWWQSPQLIAIAALSAILAVGGITSTLGIMPDLKPENHLVLAPFIKDASCDLPSASQFEAVSKRGQELINQGQLQAGIDEYRKAAALPNITPKRMAELYNDLAIALHQCGKSRESLHYLEKAVKIDDKLVAARNNLEMVRQEVGKVSLAATDDNATY